MPSEDVEMAKQKLETRNVIKRTGDIQLNQMNRTSMKGAPKLGPILYGASIRQRVKNSI